MKEMLIRSYRSFIVYSFTCIIFNIHNAFFIYPAELFVVLELE